MEKTDMSFEAALKQLNEISQKLERGDCPLDDALTNYQKAIELIKLCNAKLENAEQQVKLISEDGEDGYKLKPFTES